jgi:Carbohydrate family 9 binding domain-like
VKIEQSAVFVEMRSDGLEEASDRFASTDPHLRTRPPRRSYPPNPLPMRSPSPRLFLALLAGPALACGATPPDARAVAPPVVVLNDVPPANSAPDAGLGPASPSPHVLDAAPAGMPHAIDINWENEIHLVGYRFEPESAAPGQEVKLTFWWRCDEPLEDGWSLFTHTRDDGSNKMGNLDYVGPLRELRGGSRQALGPDRWQKGKVYVDEQTYTVPEDVTGPTVTVMVGIWKGDARLRVVSGPNDGDNSAIVGRIATGMGPASVLAGTTANDVPALSVPHVPKTGAIVVDGKDDEAAWKTAAATGAFVDVGTGKPNASFPGDGSARMLWDDDDLYVFVEVQEAELYTGFTNARSQPGNFTAAGQPKLWTRDTVEMMIEPDAIGINRDYYLLLINPQNKVFKSQFDALQLPSGGPNGPFGHEDWDPKLRSAARIHRGPGGKVKGYAVEIAIPWASFTKAPRHPPRPGDVWRLNFYAMKNYAGVAWSPILGQGNLHKASRFGKVTWTGP